MTGRNKLILFGLGLLAVALVAFFGAMLARKGERSVVRQGKETPAACAYDGTRVSPFYEVTAYVSDDTTVRFCSIHCAAAWSRDNKSQVVYFTVMDEATGQRFDSSLGHFVESDVVSVPEVKNRVHAFSNKEDALKHARQFQGKLIDNPFGTAFVLPRVAQLDTLRIGVPHLPDALPVRLAVFKPIFKENRLNVAVVPVRYDAEGARLFRDGSVDAVVCDLPSALVLASGTPSARIVKNVLRSNPYRSLFALVAGPRSQVHDAKELVGRTVAVPPGTSYTFYLESYLKQANVPIDKVVLREVEDLPRAWEALRGGEVSAALLRTPYTDLAIRKNLRVLADDRNLPWMSVLVVNRSIVQDRPEVLKRFLFGLEQSILALNLKPDEYRGLLKEEVGIPSDISKDFPMPIFEGANAPARDETETILLWLVERKLLSRQTTYTDLVNTEFLPDPKNVGLAFCCR